MSSVAGGGAQEGGRAGGRAQPVPLVRLAALYLAYFGTLGAIAPYWSLYLEHLGFASPRIGELMAIFMGTKIAAPLLAGWLTDRSGRMLGLVRSASWVAALSFGGVLLGSGYAWLAAVTVLFSFAWAAALPPFEAVTLNHLGRRSQRYGRVRLWGSIGFIVTVTAVGPALDRWGDALLPWISWALFGAIALVALTIPEPAARERSGARAPLLPVLARPAVVALLLCCLLMQASHGPYYAFFSIYLEDLGYPKSLIGPLWALGVVAEIGVFLAMAHLHGRFSRRALLLASLWLTAARWLLIGFAAQHVPVLLVAQLLHAASYGVFHATAIHFIHHLFTGSLQGRGQALYASVGFGAGGALGALLSGYAWDVVGAAWTYAAAAAAVTLALVVAWRWVGRDA